MEGEEPTQVVPPAGDPPVEQRLQAALPKAQRKEAGEQADLADQHVERRRFERLDEAVGVAERHHVAAPAVLVTAGAEAHAARLPHPRVGAPHLGLRLFGREEFRGVDVAAVVGVGLRRAPAPAGGHGLGRGVGAHAAVVGDRGDHRAVGPQALSEAHPGGA